MAKQWLVYSANFADGTMSPPRERRFKQWFSAKSIELAISNDLQLSQLDLFANFLAM